MLPLRQYFLQPLRSTWVVLLSSVSLCWAQIPNSDVGNYPSGVVTLIAASWLFFRNSTSTLYGMLPQYWLMPGLQTARKQNRDGLKRVQCCDKNCYNGTSADIMSQADRIRTQFASKGIDLAQGSKQIVALGTWSFAILSESTDEEVQRGSELLLASTSSGGREQHWVSEFRSWEEDVNAGSHRFWVYGSASTAAELLDKSAVVKTVDAISVRVGSRRRTLDLTTVTALLVHSVAAAAARDAKGCIVLEAMLISIWAGVASFNQQDPAISHNALARQWANPVLVSASTLKLRALTPPPGSNIAYDPINMHGLWVYIVMITIARIVISAATALGTSGSLWLAAFTGLYLTNASAASSFGREKYDARADCGLMSGVGFYMNFSRDTIPTHSKLHDRLESVSVVLSLFFVVVVRLFKLKLRSLLGYGPWMPSALWQMIPGILISSWAAVTYTIELIGNLDRKRPESKDVLFILYKTFILGSCIACSCLGLTSMAAAYGGFRFAKGVRWATYGVSEFHSWHVAIYQFGIGRVDGPDMWFAATSTLSATWGAVLLAVAADLGDSLL